MQEFDEAFDPESYIGLGDKPIVNAPMIDTSVFKLAEAGWVMGVQARQVIGPMQKRTEDGYTYGCFDYFLKVLVCFYDPKLRNRRFTFKFWEPCSKNVEWNNPKYIFDLIKSRDLTPKMSSQLMRKNFLEPRTAVVEKVEVKVASTLENLLERFSEVEILEAINNRRYATLDTKVTMPPTVPISLETLDNVIALFPENLHSTEISKELLEKIAAFAA